MKLTHLKLSQAPPLSNLSGELTTLLQEAAAAAVAGEGAFSAPRTFSKLLAVYTGASQDLKVTEEAGAEAGKKERAHLKSPHQESIILLKNHLLSGGVPQSSTWLTSTLRVSLAGKLHSETNTLKHQFLQTHTLCVLCMLPAGYAAAGFTHA